MKRATTSVRQGHWPAHLAQQRVTLPYDARYRRRIRLATDNGEFFLLDLCAARVLRDGDGLRLETGEWIAVCAEPEALIEVRCRDSAELARLAWHLGNRHLPVQIVGSRLRVREDPVVREMLRKLGALAGALAAPFDPEHGAYSSAPHGEGNR